MPKLNYTPAEERAIRSALLEGREPPCPRCGSALRPAPIPPPRDVSYVRDRVWLLCPECRRSAVVDRR